MPPAATRQACGPIAAQLTSRSRRMSTISCMAAPTDRKRHRAIRRGSSATSRSARCRAAVSLASPALPAPRQYWQALAHTFIADEAMPGPAVSFFTSVCDFPQKEQRKRRLAVWVASTSDTTQLRCQPQGDSQPCIDKTVNGELTICVVKTLFRVGSVADETVVRPSIRTDGIPPRSDGAAAEPGAGAGGRLGGAGGLVVQRDLGDAALDERAAGRARASPRRRRSRRGA